MYDDNSALIVFHMQHEECVAAATRKRLVRLAAADHGPRRPRRTGRVRRGTGQALVLVGHWLEGPAAPADQPSVSS